MDLQLGGKVAVVTGASKGIGLAVVKALVAEGASVVAAARDTSGDLAGIDGPVHAVAVDLTDPAGPQRLIDEAVAAYGGLDILVNNVGGVKARPGGFTSVTDEDWLWALSVNLLSAVRTTRAALPHLLARGAGSIVTVSSINAFLPDPMIIDYTASKAALTNFSKALSKEVGPKGIRVNTVSPGPVRTPLWTGEDGVAKSFGKAAGVSAEEMAKQVAGQAATGRFTEAEEVADLVVLLAGARAGNVTGADFVIDGGLITTL
ncbi:oxidoreductase [Catellatospora citrea]|uniref:3-oxoacyl-ACP reductase n=1 Tax=Catellatospora citrea TaxID=53366 RepID=A0A8J3K9M2_9ACTN|nr:oxidoreductase [Catellatospora citrea]RKE07341.1 NAD(P)-dependent dehydrogenase (short-subunit alcohol dehydrogenase family) [Catellatospora citrea]GIF95497.1 3-oxoacyl-ACP reductase [Catellatospora citrea]